MNAMGRKLASTTAAYQPPRIHSDPEKRKRQEAVDAARASVGLEGFRLSADELHRAQQYIDGEITLQEFVEAKIR